MLRRSLLLGFVVATVLPVLGSDQTPAGQGQPAFKTSTELFTLDAVVTDSRGQHVTTLSADDFEVIENNKVVPVKQAVYVPVAGAVNDGPRRGVSPSVSGGGSGHGSMTQDVTRMIALVVDDLDMSFRSTFDVRNALHKFVDNQMRPGDLVAILRTGAGVGTLQLFTMDKRLLHAAAERVQWSMSGRSRIEAFDPIVPERTLQTFKEQVAPRSSSQAPQSGDESSHKRDPEDTIEGLRQSMLTAGSLGTLALAVRSLQNSPGRKSVVFFSEGFDMFDRKGQARVWSALTRLMDGANRAGVVLYCVDARGLQTAGATAEDEAFSTGLERLATIRESQEALRYLAEQTGGFAVVNNNDLNLGLQRVLNDQQGYYLLGYASTDNSARHWDPNQLKVRGKKPGLRVRWRRGLYGPADPTPSPPSTDDALVTAALSPFNAGALNLRVTALFGHRPSTGSYVHALFFVDINDVHFTRTADDAYAGQIELLVVAVNASGQRVRAWRKTEHMTFQAAEYEDARKRGITYSATVNLKEDGGYQIRAAVMDASTGAVGSSSQFVHVPKIGAGQLAISSVLMKGESGLANQPRSQPASGNASADSGKASANDFAGVSSETRQQPAVRIFAPGSQVAYAYEIYSGLKNDESLSTSSTLLHDGQPLYTSPAQAISNGGGSHARELKVIPIGGTLTLGRDLPPGSYALQVYVIHGSGKKSARSVSQWVDFEIR
jgi:VWFA-related protein